MARFTVTYAVGSRPQTFVADRYETDGSWLVFKTRGKPDDRISADGVQRVTRTGDEEPEHPSLWPAIRWLGCGVLALMAAFCLWVGLVDAFTAGFQSGRVLGWLILLASPVCAFGAWGLKVPDEIGLGRALRGALTATAVALVIIAVWFSGNGRQPWPPLVFTLAALIATAVWVALLIQGVRPRLPVAATALAVVGVLITLFQFWYEKDYVPATKEAGLSEQVELTAGPIPHGMTRPEYVTAKITLKNVSGTKVRMTGSHYNVWNYEPGTDAPPTFVESGRLGIRTGNWLASDQEDTEQFVIRLPSDPLPAVRLVLQVEMTKGDRLPDSADLVYGCPHLFRDCPVAWEIGEGSLLHDLTREQRYLVVDRDLGEASPHLTRMRTCISRSRACPERFDARLNAVYGRVRIGAGADLMLDAPAE